jgi:hypothetical protein
MAEINELQLKIGNKEAISLKPAIVEILEVEAKEVGTKKAKKVICKCQHPDSQEPIHIGSANWENKGKLEVSGLWINKDSDGLIRKNSCLAVFMNSLGVSMIGELTGKKVVTILDNNYLTFKIY